MAFVDENQVRVMIPSKGENLPVPANKVLLGASIGLSLKNPKSYTMILSREDCCCKLSAAYLSPGENHFV